MLKQRTLKNLVKAVGIGLHSGRKVELVLRPAAADTGIVYRRTDLDPPVVGTEPLAALRGRVRTVQQRVRARLRARDSRMGIDPDSSDHVVDAVDQQIETAVERGYLPPGPV